MKLKNHISKTCGLITLAGLILLSQMNSGRTSPQESSQAGGLVHVIKVASAITPITAEFITKSIERAEEEQALCLIIELDTPGGLLESTKQITKSFFAANVPIVLYVSPQGSSATSAGVFITYAAHIAAMAPSTTIGAAHPVNIQGAADTSSVMNDKVTNYAVSTIRAAAERYGRNAEWAEQAVRESVSITENEALQLNVVNFISPSVDSLLKQIDGQKLKVASGERVLKTKNARIDYQEMNFRYRILDKISNPNIAYLLFLLGLGGLFFELSNPGAVFPGVIGALSLILAFFAFQILPVNYSGLLLILLAVVLFIMEVKITSYGLLTIGGVIAMFLGSLMLIEHPPDIFKPVISISLGTIISAVILTAAFFLFAFALAIRTHFKKVTTGSEGLIGELGVAQTKVSSEGKVKVHGEIWNAECDDVIKKGEKIRVVSVDGLKLKIEKKS